MIDLSIIIVHYNAVSDLISCIRSIYVSKPKITFEVIVVDNHSVNQAALLEKINRNFPSVRVVPNKVNVGFAAAKKIWIRMARGKVYMLLNPDTIITDSAITVLYDFLQTDAGIGMVGPLTTKEMGETEFSCGRIFPNLITEILLHSGLAKRFPKNRFWGMYLMTYWDHQSDREVDLLQGSCILAKREAVEKVGLMDERFFLFCDDVEWCYRFKKAGYKILLLTHAIIVHKGGTSSSDSRDLMYIINAESMLKFFNIHYGNLVGFAYRLCMFMMFSLKLAAGLSRGHKKTPTFFKYILWSLGMARVVRNKAGHPRLQITLP